MVAQPLTDSGSCEAHLVGCPDYPNPCAIKPKLELANEYIARGWRIIPIEPKKKKPPMLKWQHLATSDPNQVLEWWGEKYDDHGIGVAMGSASGVFVLDVDVAGDKVGDETLRELTDSYGPLPDTATVITGSGGTHYYFTYPERLEIKTDTAGKLLGSGLDVKTTGQCVAPPTIHPNGQRYEWEGGEIGEIAEAPGWLLAKITAEPKQANPLRSPWALNDDGPAERYNAATTWPELLEPDGWVLELIDDNGEQHWRRPGKSKGEGTSATIGGARNPDGEVFYVFTSSVPYLAADQGYSRFRYYAARHHDGDHKAAARELLQLGGRSTRTENPEKISADDPWAEPIPFVTTTPLPTFPVDELPEPFATFAAEIARGGGTSADFVAAFTLPIVATLAASRWRVGLTSSWSQPLNLYLLGLGAPGVQKSMALNATAEPLHKLDAELAQRYGPEIARAVQDRELREQERDSYKKEAGNAKDPTRQREARHNLDLATEWLEAHPVPVTPELFGGSDATPESIEIAMAQQGGTFSWLDDEGGLFSMTGGRYSGGNGTANLSVFLKGHDGEVPHKVTRTGRPAVHIAKPALTIGVLTQPQVFADFVKSDTGRGLMQRFLVMTPAITRASKGALLRGNGHTENPQARADYEARIREIFRVRESLSPEAPRVLTLDPQAREILARAFDVLNAGHTPGGRFDAVRGWASKQEGTMGRLAGLLAIMANPDTLTVTADAARQAVALWEYFAAHTVRAFGEASMSDDVRKATRVLEALREIGTETVVARDVHKKVRGTTALEKAPEVVEALHFLGEYGWVRYVGKLPAESGKGRPAERWAVHPSLLP